MRGAFEQCLELCGAVRTRNGTTRLHVALLRARALLRLDRADEALSAVEAASAMPAGIDESSTLRMLRGASLVRMRRTAEGLAVLTEAQRGASSAHRTIRAEIWMNVALAQLGLGSHAEAERALNHVGADNDIVYARALNYRGWIALYRNDTARATMLFLRSLGAYDACRYRDGFLEANALRALAHLAVERLDRDTWKLLEARIAGIDWNAPGLHDARFWIGYCAASYALDVEGDPLGAARAARDALRRAPSPAYRAQIACKRAAIARAAGETVAQRDHVESAVDELAEVNVHALEREEVLTLLVVAEELAEAGDAGRAREFVATYDRLAGGTSAFSHADFPMTFAYRRYIEAIAAASDGDAATAAERYRDAYDRYTALGYTRRAAMAALRLAQLAPDRALYRYAERTTGPLAPESWMRRAAESASEQGLELTGVQREVLVLICQGKSNPDIARIRKRSLHTVRNLVARLFEVLQVKSREELAVEAVRRGLYTPPRRPLPA